MNLYQHAKNKAITLIHSGDMVDLKILQSDWLRIIWSISQEPNVSQIFVQNSANNINLNYRTNSVKINDQIFQKIQKTLFSPIFCPSSQCLGQKKFSRKSSSVKLNFVYLSSTMPKFRKTNDSKKMPRQMEWWAKRQANLILQDSSG